MFRAQSCTVHTGVIRATCQVGMRVCVDVHCVFALYRLGLAYNLGCRLEVSMFPSILAHSKGQRSISTAKGLDIVCTE